MVFNSSSAIGNSLFDAMPWSNPELVDTAWSGGTRLYTYNNTDNASCETIAPEKALDNALNIYLKSIDGAKSGLDLSDANANKNQNALCRNQELFLALEQLQTSTVGPVAESDVAALYSNKRNRAMFFVVGIVLAMCVIRSL